LGQESWAFTGVDAGRANVASVYDALLAGTHNFAADHDAAQRLYVLAGVVAPARQCMAGNRTAV
jgi:hypothetical protein